MARQLRDLCYVDDVVDAFLRVGASEEADGEIYNLGGIEPISSARPGPSTRRNRRSGSRFGLVPWPEDRKRIDIGDVYSSPMPALNLHWGGVRLVNPRKGFEETIEYYRQHWRHYW